MNLAFNIDWLNDANFIEFMDYMQMVTINIEAETKTCFYIIDFHPVTEGSLVYAKTNFYIKHARGLNFTYRHASKTYCT